MEFIRPFNKLNKSNADLAGGKGASLGEMTQAGIPVPPGFVVLAGSFEQFIRETGLVHEIDSILDEVNHKEISTVEAAAEKIKGLILSREMPLDIEADIKKHFKTLGAKYVAVRSSATAEDGAEHAWAGQLESYLNTTENDLLEKVKHCWASLFTPRAIFYRFEKGLHSTKISVAVVVQKMVESEISGIAFSVHPVTEDYNQLIIEAGWGLGEAIVSGQVTPNSYVVEKVPWGILDINVSTQDRGLYRAALGADGNVGNEWRDIPEPQASAQVLTREQTLELAKIIIGIENHYRFPCDIEWAYEGGKFYIVQSRPITTLSKAATTLADLKKNSENEAKKETKFITPELKNFKPEDWDYYGFWKQDLFPGVFWSDAWVPEIFDQLKLKSDGLWVMTITAGQYFVKNSERKNIKAQISEKILNKDKKFFDTMRKVADEVFAAGVKVGESLRNAEPTLKNFDKFFDTAQRINLMWLLGARHFHEAAEEALQETVVAESFPVERVMDIIPPLVTPLFERHRELVELKKEIGSKSLAQIKKDKKLHAKFEKQVEKYPWVETFNFIGARLTVDRLYEQVAHVDTSHMERPNIATSAELKWRAECLNKCGYVKQAGAEYFSIFSEHAVPFLMNVAKEIGLTYREFLTIHTREVRQFLKGELKVKDIKKKIKIRQKSHDYAFIALEKGKTLFIEDSHDIGLLRKMVPTTDKNTRELKGAVGNPGKYTGPARVIMNTDDFHKMKVGDVLVTTMTTPDFVILMQKAGAIVTDIGGLLCHAAIISREINKPCVIGTRFATHIFKDGDMVEVDAEKGIVKILK